jgi:hypothetical protein
MRTGLMPIIRALTQWAADWHDPLDPIKDDRVAQIAIEAKAILVKMSELREMVQRYQMGVNLDADTNGTRDIRE